MKNKFTILVIMLLLVSCGEHRGHDISELSGDYRFYAGIAEFFDCKKSVKYYVADSGIYNELQSLYLQLNLKDKDDAYIKVKGYLKEEQQMDGIDPKTVFVPVKLISHDASRGCERGIMQGS